MTRHVWETELELGLRTADKSSWRDHHDPRASASLFPLLTHWNGCSVKGMLLFNVSSNNVMKRHRVPSMLPCIWQHGNGEPGHIPNMGELSHLIRWWIYCHWSMNFPICPPRISPIPVDSFPITSSEMSLPTHWGGFKYLLSVLNNMKYSLMLNFCD